MSRSSELIEEALELEQLDTDIFRSVRLWKPLTGRGVFGGNTLAQATRAAGNTVDPALHLHSLHAYFLSFGNVDIPVLYIVERVREGRSYATRSVRAVQRGKAILILSASFQRPEMDQPRFQTDADSLTAAGDIFSSLPGPDECVPLEDGMMSLVSSNPTMTGKLREYLLNTAEERRLSSIEIRNAYPQARTSPADMPKGIKASQQAIWFRSRDKVPPGDLLHKCVLAYASDFSFIGTAARAVGLHSTREPRLGMMASLDHSMHFYEDVDASDWLLFVMETAAVASGRGLVKGRIYTQQGKLAVVVQQEGVVRQQKAKL